MDSKSNSRAIGAAGEHLVMSWFLQRGYIAALVPEGIKNIDILLADENGIPMCGVQVKTTTNENSWQLNEKAESIADDEIMYAFVYLPSAQQKTTLNEIYFVPSALVAELTRKSHQLWLSEPPKRGATRKDTSKRAIHRDFTQSIQTGLTEFGEGWMDQFLFNFDR